MGDRGMILEDGVIDKVKAMTGCGDNLYADTPQAKLAMAILRNLDARAIMEENASKVWKAVEAELDVDARVTLRTRLHEIGIKRGDD